MKQLAMVVMLVLAACGGDDGGGGGGTSSFDNELSPFENSLCDVGAQCFNDDRAQCISDVMADMADAKAMLDAAGQDQCAACMHAKTVEAQKFLDANCDSSVLDEAAVIAACDTTPDNGEDSDDEACAGYP